MKNTVWVKPLVLAAALACSTLCAAETQPAGAAQFDLSTMQLTLPEVRVDNALRSTDVVLTFSSFGEVKVNDASVGSRIEFDTAGNVLKIPQLLLAGTSYSGVSLTGAHMTVVRYGPIEVDAAPAGPYTLVISLMVAGMDQGEVSRILHVQKPNNQTEFCHPPFLEELRTTMFKNSGDTMASLTVNGCAFSGMQGQIDMTMGLKPSAAGMPVVTYPYIVTYTFH